MSAMKLLVVVASLHALASAYPRVKTWTLTELSEAIEKTEGEPEMRKYYIDALNHAAIHANILSPSGHKKWTMTELRVVLEDPKLSPVLRPYYVRAYHYLVNDKPDGAEDDVEVVIPALDISTWSIFDLSDAMENPDTKPALKPYLENAQKEIKKASAIGIKMESVTMVTPVGLIPARHGAKPSFVARIL